MAIGRAEGIPVIEDAAEAIGSEYRGKKAGSIGDFGVFSFHGTKTMSTGEGGAIISNNGEMEQVIITELKREFSPEFINRVDDVIIFNPP